MASKLGIWRGNNKGHTSKDPLEVRYKLLEEENEDLKKENAKLRTSLRSLEQEAEEFRRQKRYHEENFNSVQRDKAEVLTKLADLERERDIIKGMLRRYQQHEMQDIAQRRSANLDRHRREYEQKFGVSPQTTRVLAEGEGMDEIDGPRGVSSPDRGEGMDEIDGGPRDVSNPRRGEGMDEIDGPMGRFNSRRAEVGVLKLARSEDYDQIDSSVRVQDYDQVDGQVGGCNSHRGRVYDHFHSSMGVSDTHGIDDCDQIDSGLDLTPSLPDPSLNMHMLVAQVHNDDDDGIDMIDSCRHSKDGI